MKTAYFGPAGTFTEEALLSQADLAAGTRVACMSVPEAIAAVERGDADGGVVPIENMIEGSVSVTLDTLAFDSELLIQREIDLPVSLNLCARPGVKLSDVKTVVSFPHALAQCRGWLAKKLPDADQRASHSTSDAAREVSKSKRGDIAAICNALAADLYGLDVLAGEIEDHPENQTRFVLVGRGVPPASGHDKTSIVCFQRADRPGSLLAILQEFAARAINLTKLESRPTKRGLGDYCFFIDAQGHISDDVVSDALRNLAAKSAEVKFLGSYPVGGPVEAGVERRKAVDRAWRHANKWVDGLRAQIREADAVIDLKRLRDEPAYRVGIERKRVREGLLDEVVVADAIRRALATEVDGLRARQNAASKEIGQAANDERPAKIEAAAALKEELSAKEKELTAADDVLRTLALQVPNPADASAPDGGEDDGEVVRVVGGQPDAPPMDHATYSETMGWVDTEKAAEASGSRFAYIMREAALLELALVNYAMAAIVRNGFVPVITPALVRERTMEEAGFFPTDRNQVYDVDDGELFLLGTSEVALSALHRAETLAPEQLPARYAGYSTCFRREAGTYGKDTRGIFRVHQFDKVEMFAYVVAEESNDEHERILAVEEIIGGLGLPYHVLNVAAADLGPAATKKYDLEVWLPSEGQYREITSCSNYTDYSARRMGTRVKREGGSEFVHTLNGTACAISRTLVFLFEHYQQPDGSFAVPDALRPYTGFDTVPAR